MFEYFPGVFQISRGKYIQGILIFLLLTLPMAGILRMTLFPLKVAPWMKAMPLVSFCFGIIWHGLMLIKEKDDSSPLLKMDGDVYEKARTAQLKGNYELACLYYEKLIESGKDEENSLYQLGKSYQKLNRNQDAIRVYKKYLNKGYKSWDFEVENLVKELSS